MDTYSLLREFADSWMLLVLFSLFVGIAVWAFWPGLGPARTEASLIPFRNDTPKTCQKDCATCACAKLAQNLNEEAQR